MNRVLLFFLLSIPSLSFGEKLKGYYITFSDDTVRTIFEVEMSSNNADTVPDLMSLRRKLVVIESDTVIKTFGPSKVKEYCFKHDDQIYRMVSRVKNHLVQRRFFFRLKAGNNAPLKLLVLYKKGESYGPYDEKGFFVGEEVLDPALEIIYLQKNKEAIYKLSTVLFKECVMSFIEDCPKVVEKYKNEEHLENHIQQVVADYNRTCGK